MKILNEIWKDIPDYEGLYQVSNLGRIKSLDRIVTSKRGWSKFVKGRILKPSKHHYGYLQVSLLRNGNQKPVWIHSLVAQSFIPNPDKFPCVNHKDECKTNNMVDNLEWCDIAYNNAHGTRVERLSKTQRNDPKKSKQVKQIDCKSGQTLAIFPSIAEASRQTNISEENIRSVAKSKPHCLTAGGYKWAFC